MLKCAEKAFGAGRIPYPLLMIDTGHNFVEVTDFRDSRAKELNAELIVRSVEDSMARGTVRLAHPGESRNVHQSVTLLEAIEEFRFDALIGGARRDEEKARAKERIFSHRDSFGQWQPKAQRPELWTLFNTRLRPASTSACSRSATGPNWTCGSTSSASRSPCPRSTTPTHARWWTARACWCP
jgi:sulfate adenylyltransferase subunit 2